MNGRLIFRYLHQKSVAILIFSAVVAIWAVLKYQNYPIIQLRVLGGMTFLYLSWAFLHHFFEKSLTMEIIIEYLLTVILAAAIFYGIFL